MNLRNQAGVPESSETLEVDGVKIAIARTGVGPKVVCLHAAGHGGRDFEGLAEKLKDRFEVIRLDWPGQGRSGPDEQPAEPARYAHLLHGALARLGIERPILIGNSIGGAAAIHYASRHATQALVLCNSGGLLKVTTSTRRACAVFARFFAAGERRAWWFKWALRSYYRFMVLPSPAAAAQRVRIVAAGFETAGVLRQAWLGFARPEADIRAMAIDLDLPIWFAWAKQDRLIGLEQVAPVVRLMKNARLTTFRGGHAAFLEQPEVFRDGFVAFCEQHGLVAISGTNVNGFVDRRKYACETQVQRNPND